MSRTLPRPIRGRGRSLASIVVIGQTFKDGAILHNASGRERGWGGSLRQRNEFVFVRNVREAARLPVLLGLLDPLLAGGDEIPPDMARAFQRIAAKEHHPRRRDRLDRNAIAGPKDQKARSLITVARNFNLAIDHVDGALLMIGVERHADPWLRGHLGVEPRRYHRNRRFHAERTACDDTRRKTAIRYSGQIGGRVMLKRRRDFLGAGGQGDPALQAQHLLAVAPLYVGRALEWAMPRPAVIRFMAPGWISWILPSLSRCMMLPSNR